MREVDEEIENITLMDENKAIGVSIIVRNIIRYNSTPYISSLFTIKSYRFSPEN